MKKNEFLKNLSKAIEGVKDSEKQHWLSYYAEIIDDGVDDGIDEEFVIAGLESIPVIAGKILSEASAQRSFKPQRKKSAGVTVVGIFLIILGAPLWIPLAIAFLAIIIGLFAALFGIIIALVVVLALLGLSVLLLPYIFIKFSWLVLFPFPLNWGILFIMIAIALFLTIPVWAVIKGCLSFFKKIIQKISQKFANRRGR